MFAISLLLRIESTFSFFVLLTFALIIYSKRFISQHILLIHKRECYHLEITHYPFQNYFNEK